MARLNCWGRSLSAIRSNHFPFRRYCACALAEAAPLTGGLRFDLSGGAPQRNKTETSLAAPPFLRAQTVPGRIDTPAGTGANWCDKSQGRMK